jgi:hypothetical protein
MKLWRARHDKDGHSDHWEISIQFDRCAWNAAVGDVACVVAPAKSALKV